MSLATVSRCKTLSRCRNSRFLAAQPARHSSSTSTAATSNLKYHSQNGLPPAKMRALISLYHQSESWITPENLLERIDAAFAPSTAGQIVPPVPETGVSFEDLSQLARSIRAEPKMSQLESTLTSRQYLSSNSMWSGNRNLSKRETKVFEALYGVEVEQMGEAVKVLPGVEVLDEMKDKLARDRIEDSETQRQQNA